MATLLPHPQRTPPHLAPALAALAAAYDRLRAAPDPDPALLLDLKYRARELTEAAAGSPPEDPSHGPTRHLRRRCTGAERGTRWILRHCG
ncbi:hypothetical protein OG455_33585 [Kitasatospora sp. NBC_01287]|uniref:hypothetical protein n=1 Tax=Kitasatospora sp. NBC_01287 TaxID=2903573 RepID=UPI00225AB03D|nr:hypothetical protein [Kitasatospora sp. NBC_01287]MCX4750387.1 hypothetical protein [Kitasatospora sp. NBC_01287]